MIVKTTESVSIQLTVVRTSGAAGKRGEVSVDQKVQDEINLSRPGQLADRLRSLSDGQDLAEALAKGSDEIKELTDAFERRWKTGSSGKPFDRDLYQGAIRKAVEDLLTGPHPATEKANGKEVKSFNARVTQMLETALLDWEASSSSY